MWQQSCSWEARPNNSTTPVENFLTWETDLDLPVSDTFCLYSVRELMETNFRGETESTPEAPATLANTRVFIYCRPNSGNDFLLVCLNEEMKSHFWSYSYETVTSVSRISHNGLTLQQSNRYGATPVAAATAS